MQRDGTRNPNNPARVPDTLAAIDSPQAGALRVIHPVALVVGTPMKEHEMYRYPEQQLFEVPEDGTYLDHRGSPIAFKKGDRIPMTRAAQFEAFNVDLSGRHLSRITPARAESAATENRMEPAPETPEGGDNPPENRDEGEEGLTPQQKAARTRAANQAAKDADAPADGADESDA